MDIVWLGSEASYSNYNTYFEKHRFDAEALSRRPGDYERVEMDPVFGVPEDRMGLYLLEKVGDVTVIKVHGSLTPSFSRWHTWYPGEVTSYEAIKDALMIAAESGNKDVLMDFSSGGGRVSGLSTATDLIKRLRAQGMKIDAHTDTMACSAAYWMAASCRQVTAGKMAEVGNIGTMAVVMTYANTEETMGVKFTVFKAGKYKGIGSPYEELDDVAKKEIQANIEQTNKFFLDHVSVNRNLMLSDKDKWAEGRTFYAADGLAVGLIDKVTSLDELIGSGATANNPSDNRRFEMNISAEKRAQIEAGAAPEAVLTDAELVEWNKTMSQPAPEPVAEPAPEPITEPEAAKTPATEGTLAQDYRDALKANGKLEAQLEAAQAALATAEARVTAANAEVAALLTVAQHGVSKLQTALQLPREAKSSASEVVAQFNDLQSQMAARFPTSQKSQQAPTEDTTRAPEAMHDVRAKAAAHIKR